MAGVLVLGGSIAGVRTVQQLRRNGYTGGVVLIDREHHLPYDRPPLSKAMLGDLDGGAPALPLLMSGEMATDMGIDLVLGSGATHLELADHQVQLDDGTKLEWTDALVLATGARARRSPWDGQPNVYALRTWDDAVAMRSVLANARSVVVVGAGFIGAEVTSAAAAHGVQVDLVDVAPIPMARLFGDEVGSMFVDLHHRHQVRTHFGKGVARLEATDNGIVAELDDGTTLRADAAVVGVGAELNVEWLEGSGLSLDDGVRCDAYGRADAMRGVYAVGDVSCWWNEVKGTYARSEHWTNAVEQAAVAGHNITCPDDLRSHSPVNYVWSNQHDWKIQVAGVTTGAAGHEILGDVSANRFAIVFGAAGGSTSGVLTVNWPQAALRGRKAVATGVAADELSKSLRVETRVVSQR